MAAPSLVTIGRIAGPHGVRGLLKIESFTEDPDHLITYAPWQVLARERGARDRQRGDGQRGDDEKSSRQLGSEQLGNKASATPIQLAELESSQRHGRYYLVKLKGCSDRDTAQALKGCLLAVPSSQLPAPEDGEYYWSDLIGLRVQNTQHTVLGVVDHLFETGANDVIVVKPDPDVLGDTNKHDETLVPFIDDVVLAVDIEQGVMTVDWFDDHPDDP